LMLRPGNAGSNTAADHIEVLTAAIAQVPRPHRRKLLIRADGAGASHDLLDWITEQDAKRGRSVEYSVGYAITDKVREAISKVPTTAWKPAITAAGEVHEHGDVVEITGLLDLKTWPAGMRVIVRREHPHPGAALSLFEHADGCATKPSPPTLPWPRAGRSRSSRPAIVLTLGSRTGSGMPRTAGLAGSRPASSTSTPPGRWPRPSRPTSSPGCGCSPYPPP